MIGTPSKDDMEVDIVKESDEISLMRNSILDCVAKSDGFFKSQQVGEIDLTIAEKREIASNLLGRNVPLFLQRYWKYIKLEDVPFFDSHQADYEVNFYLTEIRKNHNCRSNKVRVRNRRYEALKKMVEEGKYFSDAEMRKRSPFLYDQLIGQHLTENERISAYKEQHKDQKFSSFLMDQLERNQENYLFECQKDEDEAVVEEEDDDTEEESELEEDIPTSRTVTEQEKTLLRNEFTNIMYENFLAGKDKDFDYSSVDNNVEYDSVHQRNLDEEEKYFDEDTEF
ncbi:Coiled-coil domain-containing protein 97, partial [Stegodyphus mimosarum]